MDRDALELAMGPGAKAFIHPTEIDPFCHWCTGAQVAVEIGAGFGASAVLLLMHTRGTVHSIDSFAGDSEGTWRSDPGQVRIYVEHAAQVLKLDASRWVLHCGTSHYIAIIAAQHGLACDFLYVDGSHAYEQVAQDVEDWLPMLQRGGLLVLHDSRRVEGTPAGVYNQGWEGPTQVALNLLNDERVTLIDECWSMTAWRKL
jgi:cephalosporin hydroxylase